MHTSKRLRNVLWSDQKNCCRLLQLYPNTKYIITVVHLHNSIIFTWCINDGHPWSSYSINLTKTSVDPFSRIFAPHGGSSGVWGLEQKYLKECDTLERDSMWEPRVSLPRNPKSNFKAHHDNSMQTRSWIVVGPSIFNTATRTRQRFISNLTISNIIQHIYLSPRCWARAICPSGRWRGSLPRWRGATHKNSGTSGASAMWSRQKKRQHW